jgi:hypothetical protein
MGSLQIPGFSSIGECKRSCSRDRKIIPEWTRDQTFPVWGYVKGLAPESVGTVPRYTNFDMEFELYVYTQYNCVQKRGGWSPFFKYRGFGI